MSYKDELEKAFQAGYELAAAEAYNDEYSYSSLMDIKMDYQDFETWFYSLNTNAQ